MTQEYEMDRATEREGKILGLIILLFLIIIIATVIKVWFG